MEVSRELAKQGSVLVELSGEASVTSKQGLFSSDPIYRYRLRIVVNLRETLGRSKVARKPPSRCPWALLRVSTSWIPVSGREESLAAEFLTTPPSNCSEFSGRNLTIEGLASKTRHMDRAQKAELLCVEQLVARQLPEGGWTFRFSATQAAAEPTALALLALPSTSLRERDRAIDFLLRTQKENGSWPPSPTTTKGILALRA